MLILYKNLNDKIILRAERLLSVNMSRSTSKERETSTLKRKMTLGRRSKSLNKNKLDEVVFSQDTASSTVISAYEKVQLTQPEFLR